VFSPTDLAVAAFVALLVFGGLYLPRVGDALGRLVRRMRGIRDDAGDSPPRG
jgi:Sec-independent protein translocase protein TatA